MNDTPGEPLTLADLRFPQWSDLELLGLEVPRGAPDEAYARYGWARIGELRLEGRHGEVVVVREALVLGLHNADDPPEPGADLQLEFDVEIDGEIVSFVVGLDAFLREHLPRLLGSERDVVLALCNPHHLDVSPPPGLGSRRLHFAHGDVTSWMTEEGFLLLAERWQSRAGEPA